MGALDGHGAGDDRGLDDAALGALQSAGAQLRRDGRRELHPAFGDGFARGDGLGGHVNHGGAALGVEVAEFADGFRSHYSGFAEAVMTLVGRGEKPARALPAGAASAASFPATCLRHWFPDKSPSGTTSWKPTPRPGTSPRAAATPRRGRAVHCSGRRALATGRRHARPATRRHRAATAAGRRPRSEAHTSELPALMGTSYAVLCWK